MKLYGKEEQGWSKNIKERKNRMVHQKIHSIE
jgi:hypothetical protein